MTAREGGPRRTLAWVTLAWLGWSVLLLCLPVQVWQSDFAFGRVAGDWVVLGYALLTLRRVRPPWPVWVGSGLLWLVVFERLLHAP